ncbi:MAG: DUF4954 family protein [Treponema sp.]
MVTAILKPETFGYNFVDRNFLPAGKDEYHIRFQQNPAENHRWRPLTFEEVEALIKNGNTCTNWNNILVEDPFNPALIKNTLFAGLVRFSPLTECYLKYHDFIVPAGITNSKIISCDIGMNCAIHDCAYLAHYIIGNQVILHRIDEMGTTDHAKFGEGIVKTGEDESVRITIDVINEAGGREILPFKNMIGADAFLWACYRDNTPMMQQLCRITQNQCDPQRGYYGTVGDNAVIKSCRIIKDVIFGESAYIKGANKLKNLTVHSSAEEKTQIGEGVELVNGIIGYGCRVFYGVKAVRFVLGNCCTLKYGARLIHSVMGDNSTISCCEVLNSLIFPYHEQHHNNSFLIAALVQGQSNMAAAATVGSNHNTRGNDGEIIAGRGFWPGLSTTLKHNCRFASFILLNKGNYPAELDVPFPFSLVSDNIIENRLEIMPAYFWMYNMYALARNNKKFLKRDKRKIKVQHIETKTLACDSVHEIITAMGLLEAAFEKAWTAAGYPHSPASELLEHHQDALKQLVILAADIERSNRPVKLLHPVEAWYAYRDMLIWYGVSELADYLDRCLKKQPDLTAAAPTAESIFSTFNTDNYQLPWVNTGGQLIRQDHIEQLCSSIAAGAFTAWEEIHQEYNRYYDRYAFDSAEHAYGVLCMLENTTVLTPALWQQYIDTALQLRQYIETQIFITKNKDYTNRFRDITYRNKAERDAVLGKVEDNAFICEAKEETAYYTALFERVRNIRSVR